MAKICKKIVFWIGLLLVTAAVLLGLQAYKDRSNRRINQTYAQNSSVVIYKANKPTAPVVETYNLMISRGQTYLKNRVSEVLPFERLFMDYLQRKYGLDPIFNAAITPIKPPVPGQGEDPREFAADERIAYPNKIITTLPAGLTDPATSMDNAAINCDHIPLPNDYAKLIKTNVDAGGYYLTHVIFALRRMDENDCHFFSEQDEAHIRSQVAQGMVGLISQPDTIPDLRYESIAFLLDMGRRDLVQPSWIAQIATEQQADGGWRPDSTRPNTDHATFLALWALLAYTYPNAPNEPMIRPAER